MWHLSVHEKWFDLIKTGRKRYEGRRLAGDMLKMQKGDTVEFSVYKAEATDKRRCLAEIKAIHRFKTFEEGLTKLPLEDVLPGTVTVAAGRDIYLQYVSLATQLRDGVVFLELSVHHQDEVEH